MAAPVIDSLTFSGSTLTLTAHGGNQAVAGLHPIASCNRGTLTQNKGSVFTLATKPATSSWSWTWTDNWPGQGQGPPLWLEARVFDSDGRSAITWISASISYSPLQTYNANPALDWTGATDITSGLQTDMNACPDHRIYQLPVNGQGRINGTILLDQRTDITIDLNGGHLFPGTIGATRRDQLQLLRGTAMVVRNGIVEGSYGNAGTIPNLGGAYPAQIQYGIQAMGNNGFWFDGIEFRWITGDCWTVNSYQDNVAPHAQYGTITNCTNTTHVDRQGVSIIAVLNAMWVVNMTISDINLTTVDLEQDTSTQTIQGVRILNFTPGNNTAGSFVSLGGPGPTLDTVIATARRYPGSNSRCQVDATGTGVKTGLYVYDCVTPNAWAGPGGSANNWSKVHHGFLQSCSQPGSAGAAVKLSGSCDQIRIMDDAYTGATGIFTDDGTGKDISQVGSTT